MNSTNAIKDIVQRNKSSLCSVRYFPIQGAFVERGPQPEEIIWQNIISENSDKSLYDFLTFLTGMIAVSISFGIGTYLFFKNSDYSLARALNILLFNYLLEFSLSYLGKKRQQYSVSNEEKLIFKSVIVFQIINTNSLLISSLYSQISEDIIYFSLLNMAYPIIKLFFPSLVRAFTKFKYLNVNERLKAKNSVEYNKKIEKK